MAAADAPVASLAIVNARVWTGDAFRPWATAIAAAGEHILAVGAEEEIRPFLIPSTRVVDGRGGMLTPGFIDAHIHMHQFDGALPLPPLFLRFLKNREDVAERIAVRTEMFPEGTWIWGRDWVDATWGKQGPPTRSWLDQVAPRHPVWLTSESGDAGIANTAALRCAGITKTIYDPTGGIVRDARGEPTGLIRGGPMWRIEAALIEKTRILDDRLIEQGMERLVRAGVTSVHHNNSWHQLIIFRRLQEAESCGFASMPVHRFPAGGACGTTSTTYGRGDAWLHWGGMKGYGAIIEDRYYRWVVDASRAGLQVMAHVGDEKGLRTLLAVYERVRKEQNLQDPRFRIEHAHDMPPDLIPLIAKVGAVVSWQPPLLAHVDQRTASGLPAPQHLFNCRGLLENGVRIAFGTDATPWREYVSPLQALQMALERPGPGRPPYYSR